MRARANSYAKRRDASKLFLTGTCRNAEFNQYPGMFVLLNCATRPSRLSRAALLSSSTAQRRRKAKDELPSSFETPSIREPALGYHVANENRRRTDSSAA